MVDAVHNTIDLHLHLVSERWNEDPTSQNGGVAIRSLRTLEAQKLAMTPEQADRYEQLRDHFHSRVRNAMGIRSEKIT